MIPSQNGDEVLRTYFGIKCSTEEEEVEDDDEEVVVFVVGGLINGLWVAFNLAGFILQYRSTYGG